MEFANSPCDSVSFFLHPKDMRVGRLIDHATLLLAPRGVLESWGSLRMCGEFKKRGLVQDESKLMGDPLHGFSGLKNLLPCSISL